MGMESREDLYEEISHSLKSVKSKYFFLNGTLHRIVKSNYSANMIYALDMEKKEIVKYTYSDYKKFKKKAFTIKDVSKMVKRHPDRIRKAFKEGMVSKPVLIEIPNRNGIYYFSEENIYELRDHFASTHVGRKRVDGIITPKSVPSRQELDAMMGKTKMLYMRTEEGNFVPVWKTEEYD